MEAKVKEYKHPKLISSKGPQPEVENLIHSLFTMAGAENLYQRRISRKRKNVVTEDKVMLLNTQQAGERLGCSKVQVRTLIKHGLLVDSKPHDPNKPNAKHFALIDSKEITRFLQEHGKLNSPKRVVNTSGSISQRARSFNPKLEQKLGMIPKSAPKQSPLLQSVPDPDITMIPVMNGAGFGSRIIALEQAVKNLEAKIDQLIRMWT